MRLLAGALAMLLLLFMLSSALLWRSRAELERERDALEARVAAYDLARGAAAAADGAAEARHAENLRREMRDEEAFSAIRREFYACDADYFDALGGLLREAFACAADPACCAAPAGGKAAGGLSGPGAR